MSLCDTNERLQRIVTARIRGTSVPEIGATLGIAERTVYRELEKAREAIGWSKD